MNFSNRLQNLPDQFFALLVAKTAKAVEEGRDVINFGQGNPDQPTPAHIVKAMQQAVADPQTHRYSPFRGLSSLRKAAADFYKKEYDVDIDPDLEVAILSGTKIGFIELPLALLNPGDSLLLPDPGYPDYLSAAPLADIEFDLMKLKQETGYLPDYNDVTAAAKARAKLMYLNYPNNPTGATADTAFFDETIQFAKENGIGVVHDFAYGRIGFDGKKPVSFLQSKGAKDIGIEMYTLSKTYNMAGWRIGFAVGNAKMIEALNLIQDHLFAGVFPAVQLAAVEALNGSQQCVEELNALYEKRRQTLVDECRRIGWEFEAPKGSFFSWLPVPEGYTSIEFSDLLLDKVDIAVAPGSGFGPGGEGFVRIGLLVDEQRIIEAIQRIEKLGIFTK
ncbi:pyridoxal phosphate-dependent aminotransferase [Planococcus sp. CP5-4]|uniref:pyridoxal phosphate-dependent aminotransferase n=1 Tax=unclassified Planococcus (in: firmicutes) TaxID=2662419 RepID=UPI001C21D00E|nr:MULTISPECIES: pyridoxal phosphate-dependent aminotransferase [unclassified Planococcus (in: firmicutes)]MBU9673227.1 pyridoxal phosphate-dependent aminotransferase [Planococcus sp. CP5-4_YE]MBW6062535.1 pyridoxal phosphate-dependent aminotransferase [Planococcus sp. CP5-4]